ncbi:MAG: hypothetical protein J6K28_03940 [Alistipes sp.]|nr:hypothetical protein [Alistipes sp.]
MRRVLIAIFLTASAVASASAQEDLFERYEAFKRQAQREYGDFRSKANAEYAEFMRKAWAKFEAEPALPAPVKPKPPVQPQANPTDVPQTRELSYGEVVKPTPDVPQPQPVEPVAVSPVGPAPAIAAAPTAIAPSPTTRVPQLNTAPAAAPRSDTAPVGPTPVPRQSAPDGHDTAFDFYGTSCVVRMPACALPRLADAGEAGVSRMWTELSDSRYDIAIADCLHLRETLSLCDWGYLQLVGMFAEKCYGAHCNESVVMQTYIMAQSGYKVRLARSEDRLTMLLPSENEIWNYSFIRLDDCKYYILDKTLRGKGFAVCDIPFPGERFASLYMRRRPRFAMSPVGERQFRSKRYPQLAVTVAPNRNLLDFYNNYPLSNDWDMYALASLDEATEAMLYPALRNAVAGKSKREAADILIDFVQTAFEYKTDPEQFGYERPLFGDETFYYPYSDCEDRSILYSILVRELLGLDAALIAYPNHLATAVCFGDDAQGDYITVGGRRYTVCDPTYIGASTGMTMPDMDNARATVILLE